MRHRLLKSLRIAVTAVSLLVCGLLIVLWVRSYSYNDIITGGNITSLPISVCSECGLFVLTLESNPSQRPPSWTVGQIEITPPQIHRPWDLYSGPIYLVFVLAPHWFYVTIFIAIAALPWIKWRFSLRTLLIVLTLFAVFFGAIAMSMR